MNDDLKERLRANHLDECYEAIDRIETLTAQLESTMKDRAYIMRDRSRIIAERDAMRATLREISGMARDARGARAATARIALGMLANLAEEAANK